MKRFFPFIHWLPELGRPSVLRADVLAGLTVATILVPQAMAYAELAGLPPVYGLYAAFLPPAVAALFGSSRHLSTGPVAIASLISATTVQGLAPEGSELYIAYSLVLGLFVGLIRIALGALRLGLLIDLLSGPVVVGFTNAAAFIIAISQLHKVFGVEPQQGGHLLAALRVIDVALFEVHWPTLGMAVLAGGLLVVLRHVRWELPSMLTTLVVTTLVSWLTGFSGEVVGEVPRGLPRPLVPDLDVEILSQLFVGALTLTMLGLMEAMAIAKALAARTRQHLDINQELIGQGMANVVGGFFQSYATSGSFSRSAVNYQSGARTGFSSVVASLVIAATLLWLTPLLHYLPQATLAVVIIAAVVGLVRIQPLVTAWRIRAHDGLIGVATFVGTLALAPDLHLGVALGVGASLVLNFYRTMRPRVVFIARHLDGTMRESNADLRPDQQLAIMRFDGQLYFGSGRYFEDKVLETIASAPELRYLILDADGINRIDASGEQALRNVVERLREVGLDLYFTRAKRQLTDALERSGLMEQIGRDHFFRWNQHALDYLWARLHPDYKARCPLNVPRSQESQDGEIEYYI
ncbi:MAG: SulP family inorganic anion transporter [Gemmatimonadetes bacterium]|nr:SulP family inorganic anion transporter [Gemmatimonadota bacterium]